MNECKNVNFLLSSFIDNELSESERLFVEGHIKRCPDCQKEYEKMRNLSAILKSIKPVEVPSYEDLTAKVAAAVSSYSQTEKPYTSFGENFFRYLSWGSAMAAGLLAVIVFIFVKFTGQNKDVTFSTPNNTEYTLLSSYQDIDDENLDRELASIYYNGYVFDNSTDDNQGKRNI